jgi:hypothetical protein
MWRSIASILYASSAVILLIRSPATFSQAPDFQIVWINVGEVASAAEGQPARAGRQLFMAPDLVELSLKKITVARVDIAPTVVALKIGQQFCLTSLSVVVNTDARKEIENAPLGVAVRQDQRERLSMRRAKNDICFAPTSPGEYPVRFNSLLPARDGSTRGAQIFLRVQGEDVDSDKGADKVVTPTRAPSGSTMRTMHFHSVDTNAARIPRQISR